MSEYWVSQAKKFCEFCKCWIADNKPSRDFHEKGKKHLENVKKKIDEVRKKSIKDAQKEEEMNDSLREMNENALKAFKKDLLKNPVLREQYGLTAPEKPKYGPEPMPESFKETEDTEEKEETSDSSEESEKDEEDESVGTWEMAVSEQGYPYYWNSTSSEVTWVAPVAYLKQQGVPKNEYDKYRPVDEKEDGSSKKDESKSKKKRSKKASTPDEPEIKKVKIQEQTPEPEPESEEDTPLPKSAPENILPADIPLPQDIPLPPEPTADGQNTDDAAINKSEDDNNSDDEAASYEPKRPKSHASYGSWEQIQEEEPAEIDLGLPKVENSGQTTLVIPANEPKMKFREKTVTSLGSGPVFFKKPKKKMTAAQFLKKREDF